MVEEGRRDWVPRLRDDLIITELPITEPLDGFILSRIDGGTSVGDIADITGAPLERVQELLSRLEGLGALERPPKPPPVASRPPSKPPEPGERPAAAASPRYDPRELDEPADLKPERKREILEAYHRLAEVDHYQLLGIARTADKKEIRAAYFRLSKRFHPDTLYGKELGSFKSKMEKVFERLTQAYETLGKKKRRQSYDAYLAAQDESRALESGLRAGEAEAKAIAAPPEPESAQTGPLPVSGPDTSASPLTAPKVPKAPRPPRLTDEERKAMARRLLDKRMGKRSSVPAAAPPATSDRPSKAALLCGLRSSLRATAGLTGGPELAQAARLAEEAEVAAGQGEILAAVNAMKMALAIDPDRAEWQARHDELRAILATQMADTYLKQACYEERQGNWEAAARSWQKVAEGRPEDARAWRQAALALLEGEGDLKLARNLAQEAVRLQPGLTANRAVLARIYAAAGMKASARKELEAVVKLDPEAEIVKTLQRELK